MTLEASLPAHLRGPGTTTTKIAAGLSGAGVYRVDASGERFVLKISNATEPLDAWRGKLHIQQLAAGDGIAPPIVHVDESRRAVVSAFVVDRSFPLFYRDPATHETALAQLASIIRRLHDLPPPPDAEVSDPRARVATLWAGLRDFAVPAWVSDAVEHALDDTPPSDRGLVLSHNDVNPSNLVYDGERILLVDWDAAGVNDPFFDLAAASLFLRMDAGTCAQLLATYDGAPMDALPPRFLHHRRLVGALICTMAMTGARQSGQLGVTEPATLDQAPSLADFYRRLRSGAVSLATAEGGWEFVLALFRESTLL